MLSFCAALPGWVFLEGHMKVPKQILGKLGDDLRAAVNRGGEVNFLAKLKTNPDLKGRTRDGLLEVYRREGFTRFMDVVDHMRTFEGREIGDVLQVKGEVAEVVAEVITLQFIKETGVDWRLYKGLILGNPNNKKFSTELDMVIATPGVVSIVEVKSFNGRKVLSKECFLTATNAGHTLERDIFKQNAVHIRTFWDNFQEAATGNVGVIKSVLFSFSNGGLVDERLPAKKALMPVFTERDFVSYLLSVKQLGKASWEVKRLDRLIQKAKSNAPTLDGHIEYVRSLHHDHADGSSDKEG
jgi:hypothetical protein